MLAFVFLINHILEEQQQYTIGERIIIEKVGWLVHRSRREQLVALLDQVKRNNAISSVGVDTPYWKYNIIDEGHYIGTDVCVKVTRSPVHVCTDIVRR